MNYAPRPGNPRRVAYSGGVMSVPVVLTWNAFTGRRLTWAWKIVSR